MELVHGRTLDNIVKEHGPLTAREAATRSAPTWRARSRAVHAAGLLHCDVKAQNVVRESGGRVVLMDLGAGRLGAGDARRAISCQTWRARRATWRRSCSTPAPPRRKASDIYSFGVLLYSWCPAVSRLTARRSARCGGRTSAAQVTPLGDVRAGLPRRLVEIVTRAIDRDPARRPSRPPTCRSALAAIASAARSAGADLRRRRWWAAVPALAVARAGRDAVVDASVDAGRYAPAAESIGGDADREPDRRSGEAVSRRWINGGADRAPGARCRACRSLRQPDDGDAAQRRTPATRRSAEKLGVRLLLAGSVLQADKRIRIERQA